MKNQTITRELTSRFNNQIIRASAGTGKTFALSNRYLQLLASGAECQTILATTFTRKGAGEILDRIVNRLSDAALDDAGAEKLSTELNWKLSRKRAADVLHSLLKNLHQLEIGTLDSFFSRIAKSFGLEMGLPPGWDIVSEQEMDKLRDQSIQSVLQQNSVLDLLHLLNKGEVNRQVAALVHNTVTSIYDVFQESGPEPWDRLTRQGKFLPDEQLDTLIESMTTLEIDKAGLAKHWKVIIELAQQEEWSELATATSFQNYLDGKFKYGNTKLTDEIIEIYKKLEPHCRAHVENRLIRQNHSTRDLLQVFGEAFEAAKSESGQLRFDDVTQRLQRSDRRWTAEQLAFRLDNQIQHLLLDEFQDTSLVQWNVIRPFAQRVTAATDALRSFFCVGDMKQAIYGWRGGAAEIFDQVETELTHLEPTQVLKHSYRSAPEVIGLVNDVFNNLDRYQPGDHVVQQAVNGWSEWFSKHTTERKQLPGHATVKLSPAGGKSTAEKNEIVIQQTVEKVKQLKDQFQDRHSIGIVVRTNGEVGELISHLQQQGIPASEEGGNPITDSAAVELVLSALKFADYPGDSIARFHLSHSRAGDAVGPEARNQNQSGGQCSSRQFRSQ